MNLRLISKSVILLVQKILHDFHDLVLSHFLAMTHSERHADGGRVVSLIDVDFQVQIQRNWGGKEQKRKARTVKDFTLHYLEDRRD